MIYNYLIKCYAAIEKAEPLMPMIDAYVFSVNEEIINSQQCTFGVKYETILRDSCTGGKIFDSKKLDEIVDQRSRLQIEAVDEFEAKSKLNGDLHEKILEKLNCKLEITFDKFERYYLRQNLLLKQEYMTYLQNYTDRKRWFFSFLWTTKNQLNRKDAEQNLLFQLSMIIQNFKKFLKVKTLCNLKMS